MARWSPKEIEYLVANYKETPRDDLVETLGRTWDAIKGKASELKLKRVRHRLDILLDNSPVSFYWLGFLLADGHFATYEVKLKLSVLDETHLRAFAAYINCDNIRYVTAGDYRYIALSASDNRVVPEIRERFGIAPDKTYSPPPLRNYGMDDNQFVALLTGFIDGDGNIKRQGTKAKPLNTSALSIACHSSWVDNLRYFEERLYSVFHVDKTPFSARTKGEYAHLGIYNHGVLKRLRLRAESLGLPLMRRKWDVIDLSHDAIEPKQVGIDGVVYRSIKEAARMLEVAPVTVKRWTITGRAVLV